MQNVFITGGSSGIGLELARQLSRRGKRVALGARRAELLEQHVAELKAAGGEAMAIVCDVGDIRSVRQAVALVEAKWGSIDIAVANAGISTPTRASKFVYEEAETIVRTNFLGTLALFDAVIPGMLARGRGRFVGIASLAGLRGLPAASIYSASKAAMQAFLEAVRIELAPRGVGVTIVNPGFIRTAMTEKNQFKMPFLMDVEPAASMIADAIERGVSELDFPRPMAWAIRAARLLPNVLYDKIMNPYSKRKISEPGKG